MCLVEISDKRPVVLELESGQNLRDTHTVGHLAGRANQGGAGDEAEWEGRLGDADGHWARDMFRGKGHFS